MTSTTLAAELRDQVVVLTGCRKGARAAGPARHEGFEAARAGAGPLGSDCSARSNVFVELTDHGDPLDGDRNDALAELAAKHGLTVVATNNVHYQTPAQRRLATITAPRCGPAAASTRSTR